MRRVSVALCVILLCASLSFAQLSVGIDPIFIDQTLTSPRLLNSSVSRGTGAELNAGILANNITIRGYYLFPINSTFPTTIVDEGSIEKRIPAELVTAFTATRFEIGMPYFNNVTIIEPFFVSSYNKLDSSIKYGGITIPEPLINNTSGLGLFYGQKIVNRQAIYLKGSVTPKDKIFDGSYNVVFKNCSLGAGYTYREYENIKIKGPLLFIQVSF